jgi:hypothetical protein
VKDGRIRIAILLLFFGQIFLADAAQDIAAQSVGSTVVADSTHRFSTAYSSQRKIVRNSAGDIIVAYLKVTDNRSQVFLAISADNGTSWKNFAQVSESEEESVRTSIAVDSKDNLHVVWTKFIAGYGQIAYRRYNSQTATWSSEFMLTSGPAYSGFPSVAVDANDLIHVAWYGYDGVAYQIFYSRFDGIAWSPARKISQGFPDSVNPGVAVNRDNVVYVAWYKNNGRFYQIYVVNSLEDWRNQAVISLGDVDSYNPTIAIDKEGHVHIAWDRDVDGLPQIFYSQFDGQTWSPQLQLTFGEPGSENPSIALDPNEEIFLFYNKRNRDIYMRRFSDEWGDEVRLTTNGNNTFPSVRWSFYNNQYEKWATLDLVWTHQVDHGYEVRYAAIPRGLGKVPAPFIELDLVAIVLATAGAVTLAAIIVLRKFRK